MTALLPTLLLLAVLYGLASLFCCIETAFTSVNRTLIQNLAEILASKNLMLTGKLEHMAQRTTRNKLLSYLSFQSIQAGSSHFEIPFNRQQLADYLAVDRSAMSSELSKLQKEGLLKVDKNRFTLH